MCTGRSLTVCRSLLLPRGGGCLLQGVCSRGGLLWGGVCSHCGVCSQGGVCSQRGVCSWGGVCSQGVSAPGGVCSQGVSAPRGVWSGGLLQGGLLQGGCIPACTEADTPTPPVDRILDTHFWKYYLGPTSLRAVIKSCTHKLKLCDSVLDCSWVGKLQLSITA